MLECLFVWPQRPENHDQSMTRQYATSTKGTLTLERVPVRALGIFQITDVGAQPGSHAGADGGESHIIVALEIYADAADQIGRTFDPSEAVVEILGAGGIIDKDKTA